jgi:chromosome segregation ATPase
MRVYKIIGLFVIVGLLQSCGETVSKEDYDEVYKECQELKESLDASQTTNLNQAATINNALSELAKISGKTLDLRGDIENGTARVTQAEKISENIREIKNRINTLESKIGDDSAYKRMIANLKTIIREKEKEIESLKDIIQNQNATISTQKTKINQQQQEIEHQERQIDSQQESLKQAVRSQASLLYQAACEFERLAEDVPDVSRKKNQKKVNDWAISMLKQARLYYKKSQEYGVNAYSAISRVDSRIEKLKREIN